MNDLPLEITEVDLIEVNHNDALSDFAGFSSLKTVNYRLTLSDLPSLRSAAGLNSLETAELKYDLVWG